MWLLLLALYMGEATPFISIWQTTKNGENITLPLSTNYSYNLLIDWGDNSTQTGNYTNANTVRHSYALSGSHTVTVYGVLAGFRFNYGGDCRKLLGITQWGEFTLDANSTSVFAGCSSLTTLSFSDQPLFQGSMVRMDYMFRGCSQLNSLISWDLTGVVSLKGFLYGATSFNQYVILKADTVNDMSYMFYQAYSYNKAIGLNSSSVVDTSYMFGHAISYNQVTVLYTDRVKTMLGMFFNATSFNSTFVFTSTRNVTSMSYMFAQTKSFNQVLSFDTSNVVDFSYMFSQSVYNQPLSFNTSSATKMSGMFYAAMSWNQSVNNFNTSLVKQMDFFLSLCSSFNQPISFDTRNVIDFSRFLYGAFLFNSPITLNTTSALTMNSMFLQDFYFNQTINFNTAKVTDFSYFLGGCSSFNQPISLDTRSANLMTGMFWITPSFNSKINFTTTTNVVDMSSMFLENDAFNQKLNFDTRNVTRMSAMFLDCASYNQPIEFDTRNVEDFSYFLANAPAFSQSLASLNTSKATNMNGMLASSPAFTQNLASWQTKNVRNCSNFCDTCGVPHFELCQPCFAAPLISSQGWSVCNCSSATSPCVANGPPDLCNFTQISAGLQSSCVPPVTVPPTPGGVIISPAVNITRDNSTSTSSGFVFTLPINANFTHRGVVVQGCQSTQVRCEWQDPVTLGFLTSGCELTQEDVSLGGGVVGAQCTCDHLTVFALVLRTEKYQQPLCAAVTEDYVMLGLYAVLSVLIVVQMMRLAFAKSLQRAFLQHAILLLACVLRIIFIVIKSVVHSVAGLVFIGLLPSALTMMLFIHILVTWASIQIFSMTISPFAKLRLPFVAVVTLVLVGTIAIVVAVGATDDESVQQAVVVNGSYALAALYASVCIMVIFAGFGLRRLLITSSSRSLHSSASDGVRVRVLVSTIGISLCLFVAACLWVAAVQSDILASDTASLAVSIAFYAVDWISLCMLAVMFATSVKIAVVASKKSSHSPLSS